MYIDSCTYLADRLFHEHGVRVSKMNVFRREGEDYRVILAKCRRKDEAKVVEALRKMPMKAELCGWTDYLEYANNFFRSAEQYLNKEGDDADGDE